MTIVISQSATAVGPRGTASFSATGGVGSIVYSILAGGAGGSINSSTGVYTAPNAANSNPQMAYDTIQAEDSLNDSATTQILVGSPLLLFCEIIQREMGLASGRVYLWDQKINQPTDNGLYVAVSVPSCKPFGNINRIGSDVSGMSSAQFVNMLATLNIDIISRGPAARDRKEEVILALGSTYAQQQQEACAFLIGKLPPSSGFVNLSPVDASAIPYRYRISVNIQYAYSKATAVDYFDDFEFPDVVIDP